MKLTVMTSSAKKSERPTLLAATTITPARSTVFGSRSCSSRNCSSALCAFSTMMMAESTIAPMAIAIPPKRHDVRSQIHPPHRNERQDDGDGQCNDRHQRGADVPKKNNADKRDHDAFFNQLFAQRRDGALDQLAAVVSRHDAHTLPAETI